ncbi:DUF982 domain-containing protein [Falsirhodobacter xinxiangensis]|uniref:DUF982 domain-containing protein n=1 Tax=Falsirhodobacter xinxiangensis TaxID=2530049 RepID=UPI0010AB0F32
MRRLWVNTIIFDYPNPGHPVVLEGPLHAAAFLRKQWVWPRTKEYADALAACRDCVNGHTETAEPSFIAVKRALSSADVRTTQGS